MHTLVLYSCSPVVAIRVPHQTAVISSLSYAFQLLWPLCSSTLHAARLMYRVIADTWHAVEL